MITGYKDRLTPSGALAAGQLAWLALYIIAPVEARWSDSWAGFSLYVLGVVSLYFGFALPHLLKVHPAHRKISEKNARRMIIIFTVLGLVGFALKLIDLTVMRSIDFETQNAVEAREQLRRAEGSNLFSLGSAALLPFSSAALAIAAFAKYTNVVSRVPLLTWAGAFTPTLLPLQLASRSSLFMFVCFVLVVGVNIAPRIRWQHIIIAWVVVALLATLFAFLMVLRVEEFGSSMSYSVRYSAYAFSVPLQPWALEYVSRTTAFSELVGAYFSLLQYFLHGFFEFQYLVDLKDSDFGGGRNTFFIVPKLYATLFGNAGDSKLVDMDKYLLTPRVGVFLSFFGDFYVDFGYFFWGACVVFGFVTELLRLHVLRGNVLAFPAYILMLTQLLLAASISTLTVSMAIVSNISFLIVFGFSRWIVAREAK